VKYPKLPCAIALLMACGSDRAIARPTTWNDYTNVRFAYRACYPNWLRAGRESDDGDGRIFTDKFGGEMRVFGSYVAMVLIDGKEVLSSEAPAATPVRQAADYDAKSLDRITYQTVGRNWYVVSGRLKGKMVYWKTVTRDDRWISMQLSYPTNAASKWNPLVKHFASCLEALPPAQFDEPVRAK